MLYTETVSASLLKRLRDYQQPAAAYGFALAGGTSLSLRFGHRVSVDLDFFTTLDFDPASLANHLGYGSESISGQAEGTLQLQVEDIKVEFFKHAYPKLRPIETIEGISLWSLEDVAAMKLNAITNRGSKKDFYDVVALLDHFTLETLIGYYQAKYQPASLMMVIRSLAWFDDADAEPDPLSLRQESWVMIKKKIALAIRGLD
jgi:hypothetical protein